MRGTKGGDTAEVTYDLRVPKDHMISGMLGHTNFKLGMLFETIEGEETLKYEGLSPNYCQMRGTKGGDYS